MQKIFLICIVLLVTFAWTQRPDDRYSHTDFVRQFRRNYTGAQRASRQAAFNKNIADYRRENARGAQLVLNDFIDWNDTQIKAFLNLRPNNISLGSTSTPPLSSSGLFLAPSAFDWRTADRVTPIKNQGGCGSCWAFAAVAQYQSLIAIATNGTKLDLSQQYINQCDKSSGACNGGWPTSALTLANKTGVPLETQYPYKASSTFYNQTIMCSQTNTSKIGYNGTVFVRTNQNDSQIQQALYAYGPLTVAVGAGGCTSFMYAGPTTNVSCSPSTPLDHAILLVGYDQTRWIIKNSWGTGWGNGGYTFINKNNNTGLNKYIFILQVNLPWNPNGPTPPPIPAGSIVLTISMSDSFGNGWNGNVFGFRQNGTIVGTFGNGFTSGRTFGPLNVTIPGNITTQIVVSNFGNQTQQISFTIKAPNGTTIFTRIASAFSAQALFFRFCPAGGCPVSSNFTYYLTMTDSSRNGWQGSVLAFRQNGTLQTFVLQSGSLAGPLAYQFLPNVVVEIVVSQLGNNSRQVGFVLRTGSNRNVFERLANRSAFLANSVLGRFTPSAVLRQSPVFNQ